MKSWAKTPSGPDGLCAHSPAAQAGEGLSAPLWFPKWVRAGSASQDSHTGRVCQEVGSLGAKQPADGPYPLCQRNIWVLGSFLRGPHFSQLVTKCKFH